MAPGLGKPMRSETLASPRLVLPCAQWTSARSPPSRRGQRCSCWPHPAPRARHQPAGSPNRTSARRTVAAAAGSARRALAAPRGCRRAAGGEFECSTSSAWTRCHLRAQTVAGSASSSRRQLEFGLRSTGPRISIEGHWTHRWLGNSADCTLYCRPSGAQGAGRVIREVDRDSRVILALGYAYAGIREFARAFSKTLPTPTEQDKRRARASTQELSGATVANEAPERPDGNAMIVAIDASAAERPAAGDQPDHCRSSESEPARALPPSGRFDLKPCKPGALYFQLDMSTYGDFSELSVAVEPEPISTPCDVYVDLWNGGGKPPVPETASRAALIGYCTKAKAALRGKPWPMADRRGLHRSASPQNAARPHLVPAALVADVIDAAAR